MRRLRPRPGSVTPGTAAEPPRNWGGVGQHLPGPLIYSQFFCSIGKRRPQPRLGPSPGQIRPRRALFHLLGVGTLKSQKSPSNAPKTPPKSLKIQPKNPPKNLPPNYLKSPPNAPQSPPNPAPKDQIPLRPPSPPQSLLKFPSKIPQILPKTPSDPPQNPSLTPKNLGGFNGVFGGIWWNLGAVLGGRMVQAGQFGGGLRWVRGRGPFPCPPPRSHSSCREFRREWGQGMGGWGPRGGRGFGDTARGAGEDGV